jgi:hypothetical protein
MAGEITVGGNILASHTGVEGAGSLTLGNTVAPASSYMFRNRIINGDMRIDQRNAGSAVTNNGAETYPVDRFLGIGVQSDGTYTLQRVSDSPDNFDYSLKVTVTNPDTSIPASGRYLVRTKLEGNSICGLNFGSSAAKNITLSFYVKSSLTGTFGGTFVNGAQDRSYPFSYTISSANTWERKTITLTADTTGTWPTDNTKALQIGWSLGVGSDFLGTANSWVGAQKWGVTGETNVIANNSATFYITGVQFEEGPIATPFEHRPYGLELSLCQRYYEKSFNLNTVPANNTGETTVMYSHRQSGYGMAVPIVFKERKRIAGATTIVYNPYNTTANRAAWVASSNQAFTHSTVYSVTETGFFVLNFSSPVDTPDTTGNIIAFNWAANAEL